MPADAHARTTRLLADLEGGSARTDEVANDLMPLVYDELRALARRFMSRERSAHTLTPTALVHEAYGRLVDQTRVNWRGRSHFFAVGAMAMRRILVDHARGRLRQRRGGHWHRVTLSEALVPISDQGLDAEDLLSLDSALAKLRESYPRAARVVELRGFGGLTVAEVAHLLEVSQTTVEGDWRLARAWLSRELAPAGSSGASGSVQ